MIKLQDAQPFAPAGAGGTQKRVVFIGTAHDNGGTSILASQLAEAMRAHGYQVEEWYLFGTEDTAALPFARVFHRGRRTAAPPVLLGVLYRLIRALKVNRPDAVFGLQPLSNLLAGLSGRVAGVDRRIATLHLPRHEANAMLMMLDRLAANLNLYTNIVACGETVAESYLGNGVSYVGRLAVVPNGQRKPRSYPRQEARAALGLPAGTIVGQIGRMHEHKNQPFTVDLLRGLPDVTALFVGTGPTEQEVRDKIAALGVGGRVRFVPSIPNAEIGKFYSAVDVVLFPSRYEGLSLAAIEAVRAGTPLICSDIPSFRELFCDSAFLHRTLLIPTTDRAQWIERIVALSHDAALRHRVSKELFRLSESYSFDTMAARYLELLNHDPH